MCKTVIDILDFIDELDHNISISGESLELYKQQLHNEENESGDKYYMNYLRDEMESEQRTIDIMEYTRNRLLDIVRGGHDHV